MEACYIAFLVRRRVNHRMKNYPKEGLIYGLEEEGCFEGPVIEEVEA
jgi:hypothetical protein